MFREERSFRDFRHFIELNRLVDIGFEGHPWTWSNHWDNEGEIRQRLDRVLGSMDWFQDFESAKCHHIETLASDHSMLLLDTNPGIERKKKRFYFDKRWLQKEGIQQVVEQAWNREEQGSKLFKVTRKIRNCRIELLKWRNNVQANSRSKIEGLKQDLEKTRNAGLANKKEELQDLKRQLANAYKEEEAFWSQKSRISWLRV